MDVVTIPIQVYPDIVLEKPNDSSYSGTRNDRFSYILSQSIIVIRELDANGDPVKYSSPRYMACRIIANKIEVMDSKFGWIVDELATKAYIEKQADKALLE